MIRYESPYFYRDDRVWSPQIALDPTSISDKTDGVIVSLVDPRMKERMEEAKSCGHALLIDLSPDRDVDETSSKLESFLAENWEEWAGQCLGFCAFRGPWKEFTDADPTDTLSVQREAIKRRLQEWRSIAEMVPWGIPLFLCFEEPKEWSPFLRCALLSRRLFSPYLLALSDSWAMLRSPIWSAREGVIKGYHSQSEANIGICLGKLYERDSSPPQWVVERFEEAFSKSSGCRVIGEEELIAEWDGLDDLMIFPEALSIEGKRMIEGFVAAGGNVIELR